MLTRLRVKNFKKLGEIDIELGQQVVFIGANNSGKTTALQALALWRNGVQKWYGERIDDPNTPRKTGQLNKGPEKRPGVTINRKDLISIPVPDTNLLWHDLHLRDSDTSTGKTRTTNVRIEITVNGETNGIGWECGMEFDFANHESFYCRPLRIDNTNDDNPDLMSRMPVPLEAALTNVAFLPPMSGLAADEPRVTRGRIDVLLGEGQTAQVLRNLCFQLYDRESHTEWNILVQKINDLFGVTLLPPRFISTRGEITMAYYENRTPKIELDLSAAGRGLQQTLLLLAHLYVNPGAVLLLDEPDAHLEIIRQRQNYTVLTEVARKQGSQIIAASHSEIVLNEAAQRDMVIAFVGTPHRIDTRNSQVIKALRDIGFDQYMQAEQKGWLLYLEGSTDLSILQAFAKTLGHPAAESLAAPFIHYVANQPQRARDHFYGLREAFKPLLGIALFDHIEKSSPVESVLIEMKWAKNEIENYLCTEETLIAYARAPIPGDSFGPDLPLNAVHGQAREAVMHREIQQLVEALQTLGKPSPWSGELKVTDEFLDRLFANYFRALGLSNQMNKGSYYELAKFVAIDQIDPEVTEKLDMIYDVSLRAKPRID